MVLSFANLVAPSCTVFPSLSAAVDAGKAAITAYEGSVRSMEKPARRDYFKRADTVWPCLSVVEGVNRALRVSGDNPPQLIHGFAADYDNVGKSFTVAELTELASRCSYPPAAGGASLGGEGVHAIWLFKEPIPVLGDSGYARKVMLECYKHLRVHNFIQGFDEAFKKPDRLLSIDPGNFGWLTARGEQCLVDEVSTRMWASSVTKEFEFEGQQLDLAKVYEQVQRLYPGRWAGEFVVGARGPRFWDSSATDATAAVVTSTGMVYFTNGGGFRPWSSILGSDVTAKLSADSLAQITDNWYYDNTNQNYVYYHAPLCSFGTKSRTQLQDRLELAGIENELERKRAIVYVEDYRKIEGVVTLANQRPGVIKQGGLSYVNTTRTIPIRTEPGESKFIQEFLVAMLGEKQLQYFLAWLQDSVRCMLEAEPSYSQSVFFAGEVESGKSLLQYRILTPLFGGLYAEPMSYLLGDSGFNSELADAGHWLVSDSEGAKNGAQRANFTQRIKAITSNPAMSVSAKYKTPVTLFLNSRLTFSLNLVAECLAVLPRLGSDVLGKLCLFQTQPHTKLKGLDRRIIEGTIAQELPHFAHWLLNDYKPDPCTLSAGRYRTASYHAPELMNFARASQDSSELLGWLNILFTQNEMLKTDYFEKKLPMERTAAVWLQLILQTTGHHFSLSPNKLAAHLSHLSRQFPEAVQSRLDPKSKIYLYSVDYSKLSEEAK